MIGVLPAAGYARRLGLAHASKELLDVHGRPVIEYAVRRLETGGCAEIRVVTRPEKQDLCRYAETRGLRVVPGHPPHVGASVGLALADLRGAEQVAVCFPDTLWEPVDGFARLAEGLTARRDAVLGLFRTPDASRSDVVEVDEDGTVTDVFVKPARPRSPFVWGCLVARAKALRRCAAHPELSDALRPAIASGRVEGRLLSDTWLDIGVPDALDRARSEPLRIGV